MQAELARIFVERGLPAAWSGGGAAARLDGGSFVARGPGEAAGGGIASAVGARWPPQGPATGQADDASVSAAGTPRGARERHLAAGGHVRPSLRRARPRPG